jgi:hypothetical protein
MSLALVNIGLAQFNPGENTIRLVNQGTGNLRVTTVSVGLFDTGVGNATIDVPGTPTTATITWTGRSPTGDDTITVDINGLGKKDFTAFVSEEADANCCFSNHYVYVAELPEEAFNTGLNTVEISGLEMLENQGATLAITSFSSTFEKRLISRYWGLDGFHSRWTDVYGPNSQLVCQEFDAARNDRDLRYSMFVGGVENEFRPNSIWYQIGSGPVPTADIVDVVNSVEISMTNDGSGNYPFYGSANDNGDTQYDVYRDSLVIPAGATWACFQIESYNDDELGLIGVSALWHGLVTSLSLPPDPPTAVTLSSFSAAATSLWGSVLLLLVTAVAGVTILMLLFNRRLAKT